MALGRRSKRLGLHKQHKILKRIKEHKRDVRKESKKNPKKPSKKTTVISHKVAHREELLNHVNEINEKEKEIKRLNKIAQIKAKKVVKTKKKVPLTRVEHQNKAFSVSRMFIFILDARDPMGTRCLELEDKFTQENKQFVYVLNKIDLISIENAKSWINYLSQFGCVFPFKSSVELKTSIQNPIYTPRCDDSFGVKKVTGYLKQVHKEMFKDNEKESSIMKVAVLGLPNTGKSSFINTVKRKLICKVTDIPGVTDCLTEVTLDSSVTLIDTPSIALSSSIEESDKALTYFIRPELVKDYVLVAKQIFAKSSKNQLLSLYSLADFSTFDNMIDQISKRFCVLKSGVPDSRGACVRLIRDWNNGKIFHCSEPEKCEVNVHNLSSFSTLTADDELYMTKLIKSCVRDALQSMDL